MKKIIILLLLTFSSITAQTSNLKFTHITTDDGLSQSNVRSIIQDSYGFLWFGTFDGLNKFDGYEFKVFKSDLRDTNSLKSNSVSSLYEDSDGILWVGTDEGLCYYNSSTNNFKSFINQKNIPEGIINGEIAAITEDTNKDIWFATSKGLIKYLSKEKSFRQITNIYSKSVFKDSKGRIWVGTLNRGLNLLNNDGKSVTSYSIQLPNGEIKSNYEVRAVSEDKNNNLWVGTYGYGLALLNMNNTSINTIPCIEHDPNNNQSLSNNLILTILPDENGIWIGTDNGGINFLPHYKNSFIHYRNDPDIQTSLNNNSIYSIHKDNAGDLWFGTFSGGINYVNKTSQELNCYRKIPGNNKSLANNTVRGFAEDKEGNIWIATDGGGLDQFDIKTKSFTHYNTANTNLNRDAVLSAFIDSKDNIWIGTWAGGISQFNKNSRTFRSYTKENSSIQSNNIFDITEDGEGRLWLSSTDGLIMFNPVNQNFKLYTSSNASLPINHTEVVKVDSKGNILVGTTQGLSVFDPKTEKSFTYTADKENSSSLSTGFVTAIFEENENTLWIGTINGLNKIERKSNTIKKYYEHNGLPNNSIRGITKDNNGFLWISTNKGISKFDPKKETFKNYTKMDGIQGNEYVINSYYKTKNGMLLFGGVNGFDYFNPNNVIDNTFIPPIVFTDFQIFNKSIQPGVDGSPLLSNICNAKEIILSYKQNVFSFQFTALSFRTSNKNQYRYMLQGFDSDWNYIGTNRTASYTNIDPGEYTFIVKGSNSDGYWNDKGAEIKIIITPPFWATWWFRTIVFLLILSIVYYLINRAKLKRKSLEEINRKLELEIKHSKEAEEEKLKLAEEAKLKDEEIKKTLQEQQEYLQKGFDLLLSKMEMFSEGDLSVSIEVNNNDSFERLFFGFNRVVENFRKIIVNLSDAIQSTSSATDKINTTAEKIHEGTNEQTTMSEEVVSSVEQMSENINHSSKNSDTAAKASIEAKEIAIEGGNIVRQTIDGITEISNVVNDAAVTIKKLGDSSNAIGEIVELIDEIAGQTNLLALNAAIEAARAGEHGRGFAVVADEVQKLSERTTSATKNIASMIKQIQIDSNGAVNSISAGLEKVKNGREFAENAGKSLDKIISAVSQVSEVIEQVATANEEQSATAKHISESIVSINNVSRENSNRVEQVTAAINDLRKLTEGLELLIHKFHINKYEEEKSKSRFLV